MKTRINNMVKKKIYLKDIAKKLKISQNTVSLALRGRPGIKEETRKKIIITAKEMGYSRFDSSNINTILLVTTLTNITDSYFYSFLQQTIEDELIKYGYTLVVSHIIDDENNNNLQISRMLKQIKPKGILILGEIDEKICYELLDSKLPIICIGFYFPNIAVDAVIEDNINGMYTAMRCLYDKGYRSYGFIGDIKGYIAFWERWISFIGFLKEYKLSYKSELNVIDHPIKILCDSDLLTKRLKKMSLLPEVFICANDKIAATTIKSLYSLGYNIPNDIGILGFDNSELVKMTIPTLTTVDSFRTLQGLTTVRVLINKIKNPDHTTQKIVIPTKFIEGLSTKKKLSKSKNG